MHFFWPYIGNNLILGENEYYRVRPIINNWQTGIFWINYNYINLVTVAVVINNTTYKYTIYYYRYMCEMFYHLKIIKNRPSWDPRTLHTEGNRACIRVNNNMEFVHQLFVIFNFFFYTYRFENLTQWKIPYWIEFKFF